MTSRLELTDVLADLYLQTPSEFVSVRSDRVRAARGDGDAELARRIGRLPKPSVAAWLANLLAARRTAEVDELVDLGALIRDAEKNLDAAEMRQLGKQRLQLIRALAQQGKQLASEAGQKVSPAAMLELEQTLHAAMSDPAAADAVRSGRLLRSLASNGIEPVDVDDAVALPEVAVARASRPVLSVVEKKPSARAVAEAEKKADDALARVAEADAERAAIREKRTALAGRRAELARERDDLAERLSALDRELASTEREENALSRDAASADHRADVATRAAERATERLRSLRKA
ncbi:transposase [Mycetocola sp. 2940]|uniref:transposase n=1 Tax=Mycetocola sp. 2940 TaxID=3156452 RepID=UPI0033927BDA